MPVRFHTGETTSFNQAFHRQSNIIPHQSPHLSEKVTVVIGENNMILEVRPKWTESLSVSSVRSYTEGSNKITLSDVNSRLTVMDSI